MHSTGIVRQIDVAGRIVLPMSIRNNLGLKPNDSLEFFTDDKTIVLQKYSPSCFFCKSMDSLVNFNGFNICKECAGKISEL